MAVGGKEIRVNDGGPYSDKQPAQTTSPPSRIPPHLALTGSIQPLGVGVCLQRRLSTDAASSIAERNGSSRPRSRASTGPDVKFVSFSSMRNHAGQ